MAVPASGVLSLIKIRREISNNNYNASNAYSNVSLNTMSTGGNGTINTLNATADRPNGSQPHNMSEFYNYDHDKEPVGGGNRQQSNLQFIPNEEYRSTPCGGRGEITTWYHSGEGLLATLGDRVFADAFGNEIMPNGGYLFEATYYIVEEGRVQQFGSCGKSERRLKYNIEFIGDSPMGIPMYHFNYKDESHGKGRFVGTMVDDLERLGFSNTLLTAADGSIFVNYSQIDVPFHNVTI